MNVWIDGYVFERDHQIGIWRIFYEIMRRTIDHVSFTLLLRDKAIQPIPSGAIVIQDQARRKVARWDLIGKARRRWSKIYPPRCPSTNVFHSTYFTSRPDGHPAEVVTVHDMIAERMYPLAGGSSNSEEKRDAILSASVLIVDSEATAADLRLFYPQVGNKIRVIHLGVEHLAPPLGAPPAKLEDPTDLYALFVGDRDSYKNFVTVLHALQQPAWPSRVRLQVVGRPLVEHEWRLIEALGLRDRVRATARVPDQELRRLYSSATCLIFPSLLEGFGIPVLEAQVNGCPAVLSDIAIFHEVAGEAAMFFDPRLGERLAEAVAAVCEPGVRRRLVEAGYENTRRFSWDRAAIAYAAVYEEAARAAGH